MSDSDDTAPTMGKLRPRLIKATGIPNSHGKKLSPSPSPAPREAHFQARSSILDEAWSNSTPAVHGFFALFWITISLYAAVSVYKNKAIYYMGISLRLWKASYCDFEALIVMIGAIYLYTYIAMFVQRLMARRILLDSRHPQFCRLVQYPLQAGPILMAMFVAKYRVWPHLQTGSLLMYAISMTFKMHSFFSVNRRLDSLFHSLEHERDKAIVKHETVYPHNLNIIHYTSFLWFPTLIYELEYPRTRTIRLGYLTERTAGILVIFSLFYLVASHYVHPILQTVDRRPFLDALVDLLLPCLTSALLFFFLVFEYILNWTAEITYFADRQFYADWWNSKDMAEFARKWNIPVHRFLQKHVYQQCRNKGLSTFSARFLTFFYSAILHEIVLSMTAGKIKFWILCMQMMQLPLISASNAIGLPRKPFVANCIWWLMIILGIPILVLLYSRDV